MQCRVIRLIIAVTRGSRNIRRRGGATLSDRWVLTRCVCSPLAAKESEGTFDCVDGATWKCDKWTQWPISYKVWNFHRNRSKNSEHLSHIYHYLSKMAAKNKICESMCFILIRCRWIRKNTFQKDLRSNEDFSKNDVEKIYVCFLSDAGKCGKFTI